MTENKQHDKTAIVAWAYAMGTLKRVTRKYAYISNLRYEFNEVGDITRICARQPKGNHQWREVEG